MSKSQVRQLVWATTTLHFYIEGNPAKACHTLAVEGPRDLNKTKRRDAILDAAVILLGTRDSNDITTEEIAALAGVSAATVYNLVGTRNELMYQLVSRILTDLAESLKALDPGDPIAEAQLIIEHTVRAFVSNPNAYRQVVAVTQRAAAAHPTPVEPASFQVVAMRQAQSMGIIRKDIDASGLARQIFLSYTGAAMLWSAGRIDDAGFLTAARHGLFTALAAAATDDHREQFIDRMRPLSKTLEKKAWRFKGPPNATS
jgi:AcrR family transcriptional regulator